MRKAPKRYAGGGVTGPKPKIDRTKYQSILSQPIGSGGIPNYTGSPGSYTPEILGPLGYKYISGSEKAGDLVYQKGNDYYLFNKQGDQTGLVSIGDPFAAPPVTAEMPQVKPKPSVDPDHKPIDFNTSTAPYNPNTGTYTTVTGQALTPIVEQYKKGGLVGKTMCYAVGGPVDPLNYLNSASTPTQSAGGQYLNSVAKQGGSGGGVSMSTGTASNLVGVGTQLLNLGGGYLDATNTPDQQGYTNVNRATTAGALKGAGQGAAIGSQIGSVIPGVGTLIGAGAGAAVGAGIGGYTSNKKAEKYNRGVDDEIAAEKAAEKQKKRLENTFKTQNAVLDRELTTYKDGGKIVGKGTGISDSIKAKIEPGSFIVPAKNADIAQEISEKVLKKAPKKAKLNQGGGVEVKVSNGEYQFTPEETAQLEAMGVNLNELAPDAQTFNKGGKVKGYEDGGKVDTKKERAKLEADRKQAQQRLRVLEAQQDSESKSREKAALEYQLRQLVKKEYDAAVKDYVKAQREAKAIEASYAKYDKESANIPKSELDKYTGFNSKPTPESVRGNKEKILKELESRQADLADAQKRIAAYRDPEAFIKGGGNATNNDNTGSIDYFKGDTDMVTLPSATGAQVEANLESQASNPALGSGRRAPRKSSADALKPNAFHEDADVVAPPVGNNEAQPVSYTGPALVERSAADTEAAVKADFARYGNKYVTPAEANKSIDYNKLIDAGVGGLSTAINYGLPLLQAKMGWDQLQQDGPRPVDNYDPAYLDAINKANQSVKEAEQRAKYGFTADEKFALDQQNQNLLNAGRFAARNYSGGSAANAINMERQAINDSFGRGLQTKINDNALKMQKQQEVQGRQAYANSLLRDKVELDRRLFNDTLGGWNQDQAAGAALLGAGLSNTVQANRYEQEKRAIANANKTSNSWIDNLNTL